MMRACACRRAAANAAPIYRALQIGSLGPRALPLTCKIFHDALCTRVSWRLRSTNHDRLANANPTRV